MKEPKERLNLKQLKVENGITLIALVITIIVLLILAAVSIATLTGNNGILTKAQTAKTTNDSAQAEEEMKLVVADWQLEKRSNSSANLGEFLNSKKADGELDNVTDNGDESYTIERNGYEATISDEEGLGEITKKEPEPPLELLNPGDKAKLTQKDNYVDGNGNKATIPEGFTVSAEDNTIDTGLVVIAPDGSEFVWVPVPKAIYSQSPNEPVGNITEKAMAVKDPTDENYYRGVLYNFSGTISSVITGCTTTNFDGDPGHREPAYLSGTNFDNSSTYNPGYFDETSLKNEYKAIVESVEKYGGFYVGRYETSINGSNVASKRGVSPMSAADNNQNWYGMYNKQKNYASNVEIPKTSKKLNAIVGSSMIWGSQYDAMLNWILTGADKSKVTASSTTYQGNTGNPNDVMNKIYDLGNNLYEWTLEAYSISTRVRRGSNYNVTNSPSNRNRNHPILTPSDYGSRLTLYIK